MLQASFWRAFRATGTFSTVVLTACARADGTAARVPGAALQAQGVMVEAKKELKSEIRDEDRQTRLRALFFFFLEMENR